MNKIFLPVVLFFLFTITQQSTCFCQALYPVSLDEKVEQSTLIVEGKVTGKTSFWNPLHTMIYTSNTVEVYKIFKGNLTGETIEIMTQGGTVGDFTIDVSEVLQLFKGDVGVFFCLPNKANLKAPASKQLLWDVYSSAQGCFKYFLADGSASAPFAKYANVEQQLYLPLAQKLNRQPQVLNRSFVPHIQPIQSSARLSAPVISGFSPATVKAGSYAEPLENTLTINGSGFGTATGSAGINFDNPDDGTGGTPLFVAAGSDLIVSWTNVQIVVKVPAKVGTGTFSVVDAGNTPTNSPTPLQVKYAILNGTYGVSPINRMYALMNINGTGGYNYVYSTNTAGSGVDFTTSSQKTTFERALTTWNEVAGLNFVYGGTTTAQNVNPGDGTNIIMLDNTNTGQAPLSAGILAVTYSSGLSCTGSLYIQRSGFDIVIRNPGVSAGTTNFNLGPCKTSTGITEFDLETTILHELGHALNLGHINDTYSGSFPNLDPAKLMNYAIVNGTDRRSPDWSSFVGAQFCINPKGLDYGSCLAQTEMIPLTPIVESKDECPVSFPGTATANNTLISFDLNHATSNKNGDPQYTAVNCTGTGTGVTNTAYYAIKTNATGGTVTLTVTGYATLPTTQKACTGAGVELALYQTSFCPAGQSFPTPVACRTFNASGVLANFTGLAANTNYLIMMDGISNTKANFSLLFNGVALPLKIAYFSGVSSTTFNTLNWKAENINAVDKIALEGSEDGINFSELYRKNIAAGVTTFEDNYKDYAIAPVKYYRLKLFTSNGAIEYSNIILLKQETRTDIVISPNPATDFVNVALYKQDAGEVIFNLQDAAGKLLRSVKMMLPAGRQSVRLSVIKGIAKGNYFLQINTGKAVSSHKLLVQ